MSIIVKDCAFCGSENVEIDEVGVAEFAVSCQECRCIGPIQGTVMEAISYWNDRRPEAALQAALTALVEEKQPLGIEREAYQTALRLIHSLEAA
jgi:hypothetical protein